MWADSRKKHRHNACVCQATLHLLLHARRPAFMTPEAWRLRAKMMHTAVPVVICNAISPRRSWNNIDSCTELMSNASKPPRHKRAGLISAATRPTCYAAQSEGHAGLPQPAAPSLQRPWPMQRGVTSHPSPPSPPPALTPLLHSTPDPPAQSVSS